MFPAVAGRFFTASATCVGNTVRTCKSVQVQLVRFVSLKVDE